MEAMRGLACGRTLVTGMTLVGLAALFPDSAQAQRGQRVGKYEFGGGAGIGFYNDRTVSGPQTRGDVGLKPGVAASAWLGQNMYNTISGEIRYDLEFTDLKLKTGSAEATFSAQTHAIHYDLHFHFAGRQAPLRPFVLVGAGVKLFRGTGQERAFQPGGNVAVLTRTSQIRPLVTFGGGLKFAPSQRWNFRLEVRDNFSQFPNEVIAPVGNNTIGGWLHNILVLGGISVLF